MSFLEKAIQDANDLAALERPMTVCGRVPGGDMQQVLLQLPSAPKKEEPKVHLEIGAKIQNVSLAGLAQPMWPASEAVDFIANEVVKLTKKGIKEPFVFVDLKSFLPPFAQLAGTKLKAEMEDDDEQGFKVCSHNLCPNNQPLPSDQPPQ